MGRLGCLGQPPLWVKNAQWVNLRVAHTIFIDPHYIGRPVPHDHKQVDRELDPYPIALRQGITTLYRRKV